MAENLIKLSSKAICLGYAQCVNDLCDILKKADEDKHPYLLEIVLEMSGKSKRLEEKLLGGE